MDRHAGPRASLGAALSIAWLVWAAFGAWKTITLERYHALGLGHLEALAVRDVVVQRLPWLVASVPVALAVTWLTRRPRGLAFLLLLLPIAAAFAIELDAVRNVLRRATSSRETRLVLFGGLVAAATACAVVLAFLVVRWRPVRAFCEAASRRFASMQRALGSVPFLRHALVWPVGWIAPALAMTALAWPSLRAPSPPSRTSVVLVLIDTLRADHLGFYGYGRSTSPRLDVWSQGATVFDAAVAQASWTKPSVATLFTSLMPSVHATGSGIRGRRAVVNGKVETVPQPSDAPVTGGTLPAGLITLAEAFRQGGYRTAGFVANSLVSARDGYGQGFETYETLDDRSIAERAARWLSIHRDRPFFLYLHFMAPHAPYDPPRECDIFGPGSGQVDIFNSATKDSINFTGLRSLSSEDVQGLINQYDGEVRFADGLVASVLDVLEALHLNDRTTVALTADHGEEFLEHGMVWHESIHLYQELTRVPLAVRLPGQKEGRRVGTPVMLLDLAPTLLDLAGLDPPAAMQGRSLAGALGAETPRATARDGPPQAAYSETVDWGEKQAIWLDAHKLICDREAGRLELYHLAGDPLERNDLSQDAPELRAGLVDSLNQARDRNGRYLARMGIPATVLRPDQIERLRSLGYIQ